MPAHSRSKNGVAEPVIGTRDFARSRWLAYGAGIHDFISEHTKDMAGTSPAMTEWRIVRELGCYRGCGTTRM
jgi:hypothetical protein